MYWTISIYTIFCMTSNAFALKSSGRGAGVWYDRSYLQLLLDSFILSSSFWGLTDIQYIYILKVYNGIDFDICLHLWNYHRSQDSEAIHHPQVSSCPSIRSPPNSQSLANHWSTSVTTRVHTSCTSVQREPYSMCFHAATLTQHYYLETQPCRCMAIACDCSVICHQYLWEPVHQSCLPVARHWLVSSVGPWQTQLLWMCVYQSPYG